MKYGEAICDRGDEADGCGLLNLEYIETTGKFIVWPDFCIFRA